MGYLKHLLHAEHVRIYRSRTGVRFRQWLARKILPHAKQAHVWAAMQLIDEPDVIAAHDAFYGNFTVVPEHMRWRAKAIIEHELDQIFITARVAAFNTETEEEIVNKRLARRYDPGMAMNEAFDRAAKKMAGVKPGEMVKVDLHPGETLAQAQQRMLGGDKAGVLPAGMGSLELSDKQQAALKFQEDFLRKNAARAPRPLGE